MALLQKGLTQQCPTQARFPERTSLPKPRSVRTCARMAQKASTPASAEGPVTRSIKQVQGVAALLRPWFAGPPAPLTDTLPPQSLGDPDSRWVCVDGIDLHYKEVGPAESQTAVLLIHGFNGSAWNWQGVMPALAEAAAGARVIAFDRPPFGLTQRPLVWEGAEEDNPYTSPGAARLAVGLLDALGIKKAIIVGHSAGALVTMELFKRAPERVLGMVFVAPALPTNEPGTGPGGRRPSWQWQLRMAYSRALLQTEGPALHYVRGTLLKKAEEVRGGDLSGVFHDVTRATPEMIETYLRPLRAHDWDRGALLSFRAMKRPEALPYEAVTQPVLLVIGSQDNMLLKSTQKVTELLRARPEGDTRYTELPECGHVPMQEQPDAFVAAVAPFLREVVGSAAAASSAALGCRAAVLAEQATARASKQGDSSGEASSGAAATAAAAGLPAEQMEAAMVGTRE